MKTNSTNLSVTALGAIVSSVGYGLTKKMLKSRVGAGILGFGLAHLTLGLLDMNRPQPSAEEELDFHLVELD